MRLAQQGHAELLSLWQRQDRFARTPRRKAAASGTSSGLDTQSHQGAFQAAAKGRHARCSASQHALGSAARPPADPAKADKQQLFLPYHLDGHRMAANS